MHTPSKGKSPHIKANLRKCTQTCTALQILLSTSRYSPHQWKPVGSWNRMRNVSKHIPVDYKISGLIWSTCEAVSPESVCVCACARALILIFPFFYPPLSCCVMFFFSQTSWLKEEFISFPAGSEGLRLPLPALCQEWGEIERVCWRRLASINVLQIRSQKNWTQILITWPDQYPTGICCSPLDLCEPKKVLLSVYFKLSKSWDQEES